MAGQLMLSCQNGQVLELQDQAFPSVISLRLEGWDGFRSMKCIATRAKLSPQVNAQVLHTLGGDAFIYVFGDRATPMLISGIAFETICGDAGRLGVENVLRYFDRYKASNRKTPLKVTIGRETTRTGYLFSSDVDTEEAARRIWRFNLVMIEIPRPRRLPPGEEDPVADDAEVGGDSNSSGSSQELDPAGTFDFMELPGALNTIDTVDSGGFDSNPFGGTAADLYGPTTSMADQGPSSYMQAIR